MIRSGQTRVKAPRKERAVFKEIKKREDLQKSSLFLFYTLLSGYFANKEEGRWFMAPLQSMNWFLSSIIAFASAIIASMGIGGGAVLLLFL